MEFGSDSCSRRTLACWATRGSESRISPRCLGEHRQQPSEEEGKGLLCHRKSKEDRWPYVYNLTARRSPGGGRYLKCRPPGRYFIYRPPRRHQAPRAAGHLAGIVAAMGSNASSKPATSAFQAPSTVLVHRPARLVGAVVTPTYRELRQQWRPRAPLTFRTSAAHTDGRVESSSSRHPACGCCSWLPGTLLTLPEASDPGNTAVQMCSCSGSGMVHVDRCRGHDR